MHLHRYCALALVLAGLVGVTAAQAEEAAPAGAPEDATPLWAREDDTIMTDVPEPPALDLVIARFAAALPERCDWALGGSQDMRVPEVFDFTYRYDFDEADAPGRPLKVYRFFCSQGAYNAQHAYFLWDERSGLRPVSFASPTYEVEFEKPDNPDSAATAVRLTGMGTVPTLVNSGIDPDTGTLTSMGYWRGLGDASAGGTWVLQEGEYRLESFDVDPSYDGEVTYFRVVDFGPGGP